MIVFRGQELRNPPGVAIQHRFGSRDFFAEQRIFLLELRAQFGVAGRQILEAHRINLRHLADFDGRVVAFVVRRGSEMVTDIVEHAGGVQPVARGFKLRLARNLADAQSRYAKNLFGLVETIPLHRQGLDRPGASRAEAVRAFLPRRAAAGLACRDAFEPDSQERPRNHTSATAKSFIPIRSVRTSTGPSAPPATQWTSRS